MATIDIKNPKQRQISTIALLEQMEKQYKNIPMEAILKQDVLRIGINFSPESLTGSEFKSKDYFIFSFDHIPVADMEKGIAYKTPEEIKISGGHFNLLPTVISTRNNPESPYVVRLFENKPCLYIGEVNLGLFRISSYSKLV